MTELLSQTEIDSFKARADAISHPHELIIDLLRAIQTHYGWVPDDGVLLTADLGKSGLQQLFATELPGRASLLKLPHHGSRHSRPDLYLDRLKPSAAFVSSGRGNPYGFPHQQVIEACAERQIPLFRTDQGGMLAFRIDNGRWLLQTGKALQLTHFKEFVSLRSSWIGSKPCQNQRF